MSWETRRVKKRMLNKVTEGPGGFKKVQEGQAVSRKFQGLS